MTGRPRTRQGPLRCAPLTMAAQFSLFPPLPSPPRCRVHSPFPAASPSQFPPSLVDRPSFRCPLVPFLQIGPEGVVAAVQQFVSDSRALRRGEESGGAFSAGGAGAGAGAGAGSAGGPGTGAGLASAGSAGGGAGRDLGATATSAISGVNPEEELADARAIRSEMMYWERVANSVPESRVLVWKVCVCACACVIVAPLKGFPAPRLAIGLHSSHTAPALGGVQTLEKGLERYHTLLQERLDLVDEVEAMRRQNQELRNALNQVCVVAVCLRLVSCGFLSTPGVSCPHTAAVFE